MVDKDISKPGYVFKAEARKLDAEAESFMAVAAKERQEARRLEATADAAEIDLKEKRRKLEDEHAGNAFHQIYRFSTEVNPDSVSVCIKTIDVWRRVHPDKPITIIFSSPGGDVVSGMALWDYLQEVRDGGTRLTTVAQGMAASMAGILLQAGDVRVMGKESYLLVHEIQAGMMGTMGDLQDRMKWLEKVQERILDIFATRCSAATGRDFKSVRKAIEREWTRTDWWLDSNESLRLGFVDKVQ